MKILTSITLLSFFCNAEASMNDFVIKIKYQCPKSKTLMVKKSLLELIRGPQDCEGTFTKALIDDCSGLNCDVLVQAYSEYKEEQSGVVIGR